MENAPLNAAIDAAETALAGSPAVINDRGLEAWEQSFEAHSKWFRTAIDDLLSAFDGSYSGEVGGHTLTLAGVSATVEDGYRALLAAWIKAAEAYAADHFQLPADIAENAAKLTADWQKAHMFDLAERLQELGVKTGLAAMVEVNVLIAWACRVAMLAAGVIDNRPPDEQRWRQACADEFERTAEWYAKTYPDYPKVIRLDGDGVAA